MKDAALHADLVVVDLLRVEVYRVVAGPQAARAPRREERPGVLSVEVHVGARVVRQQLDGGAELRAERVEDVLHHRHAVPERQRVLEVQPVVASAGGQNQAARRLDAELTEDAGDADVVVVPPEPEELPVGLGRVLRIEVVERPAERVGVGVNQVAGPVSAGPLVRSAGHERHRHRADREVALVAPRRAGRVQAISIPPSTTTVLPVM